MPPYSTMDPNLYHQQSQHSIKHQQQKSSIQWVEGAIIVGAGPSGLATAACLKDLGVSTSVILEKSSCIASLWQHRTYDRLRLHIPKQFCQLPLSNFPQDFPTYPTKQQFVDYLESYAKRFEIKPRFGEQVQIARFDPKLGLWRVGTIASNSTSSPHEKSVITREYVGRWLVVASGENAEARLPVDLPGSSNLSLRHKVYHSSDYRNGSKFSGERVLIVGAGNSGMEIALDLVQFGAKPSISIRSPIHILPREMLGKSTFAMTVFLLKLLPLWLTDRLLVMYALLVLGETSKYGIRRPKTGPMEMKAKMGKTPVLDIGTLARIKKGDIQVLPAMESFTPTGARFVNGEAYEFDSVIFATGYTANVPKWLKETKLDFSCDGFPKCDWRADRGLYTAGFSRRGILGVSKDARMIAQDIHTAYIAQHHQQKATTHTSPPP